MFKAEWIRELVAKVDETVYQPSWSQSYTLNSHYFARVVFKETFS